MKSAVLTAPCSRQAWVCWLILGTVTLIQCTISVWQNGISFLQKLAATLLKKKLPEEIELELRMHKNAPAVKEM